MVQVGFLEEIFIRNINGILLLGHVTVHVEEVKARFVEDKVQYSHVPEQERSRVDVQFRHRVQISVHLHHLLQHLAFYRLQVGWIFQALVDVLEHDVEEFGFLVNVSGHDFVDAALSAENWYLILNGLSQQVHSAILAAEKFDDGKILRKEFSFAD